ncbi:unnamed protein product [Amoebophrya sp. A25]|nr:unnamed protein product [Amoebophrya sp. A25]|eukprot:GSA25T00015270001.1
MSVVSKDGRHEVFGSMAQVTSLRADVDDDGEVLPITSRSAAAGAAGEGNLRSGGIRLTEVSLHEGEDGSEQRRLPTALWVALFFGGMLQLCGFSTHLVLVQYLQTKVFGQHWGSVMNLPYAATCVVGSLSYVLITNLRRYKGSCRWAPFHGRFVFALAGLTLSFAPTMILAVRLESFGLGVASLLLLGLAQNWLAGCLSSLAASLNTPSAFAAYVLGCAAAAWPATLLGIAFALQESFQPSKILCMWLYAANGLFATLYYLFYVFVFRKYITMVAKTRNPPSGANWDSQGEDFAQANYQMVDAQDAGVLNVDEVKQQRGSGNTAGAPKDSAKGGERSFFSIIGGSWKVILAMFLQFVITFIVFPSVVFLWSKSGTIPAELSNEAYWQVLHAIFQVGDAIGRFIPSISCPRRCCACRGKRNTQEEEGAMLIDKQDEQTDEEERVFPFTIHKTTFLLVGVLIRGAVVLPLFYIFALFGVPFSLHVILMLFFGLTQGYFTNNLFMKSGKKAQSDKELGVLGPAVSTALVTGILVGAAIQLGISKALPT